MRPFGYPSLPPPPPHLDVPVYAPLTVDVLECPQHVTHHGGDDHLQGRGEGLNGGHEESSTSRITMAIITCKGDKRGGMKGGSSEWGTDTPRVPLSPPPSPRTYLIQATRMPVLHDMGDGAAL